METGRRDPGSPGCGVSRNHRGAIFRLAEAGEIFFLDRALFNRIVGECGTLGSNAARFARSHFQGPCPAQVRSPRSGCHRPLPLGFVKRAQAPDKIYRNEAIFFLGVLATGGAITQLGIALDTGSGHYSLLLLLSFLVYAILGVALESNLIWVFALASLGGWMGTETGYMSGWGAYYLGMNYPLRFVLFGAALTGCAMTLEHHVFGARFYRSTLVMGLLYLFTALWIMSIFGNYGDMNEWERAKQIELFHWSLIFGGVAGWAIYYGLRHDNDITKGFGMTFLGINLYTRFFELFWNSLHKAIFFALLAASFWYIGSKAETIWNLGKREDSRRAHPGS